MTVMETIVMHCIINGIEVQKGRQDNTLVFRDYRYTFNDAGEICKVQRKTENRNTGFSYRTVATA